MLPERTQQWRQELAVARLNSSPIIPPANELWSDGNGGSKLEEIGLQYPQVTQETMFRIQNQVLAAIKLEPQAPFAKRHIGEFVTSQPWRNIQKAAIFGVDFDQILIEGLGTVFPPKTYKYALSDKPGVETVELPKTGFYETVRGVANHVNAAVKEMASYGKSNGSEQIRRHFLGKFGQCFDDGELAVVSGGAENALRLVKYTLENSLLASHKQSENPQLTTIDARTAGKNLDQWENIMRELSAPDSHDFINVIVQDGEDLPDEVKQELKKLMAGNKHLIVTDVINKPFSSTKNHLALDRGFDDRVITVDDSPLTRATGISAVLAEPEFARILQTYHTRISGPPPSTQANMRLLLAERNFRAGLMNMKEAASLISTPLHGFLRDYLLVLEEISNYLNLADNQPDTHLSIAKRVVAKHLVSLEHSFAERFKTLFPDNQEGAVINGGGRTGLVEGLAFLKEKHQVNTVLVAGPCWTYNDIRHMIEDLEFAGISDMEIVFEPNGFATDGQINLGNIEEKMQQLSSEGKKFVIISSSGPTNPAGTVISNENKTKLYHTAAKYHSAFIDDAAYVECVDPDKRDTFAQIHQTAAAKVAALLNIATLSKGVTSMPSGRLCYLSSDDSELKSFLVRRRSKIPLNSLSILLADAITRDQEKVKQLENFLWDDIKKRRQAVEEVLTKRHIKFLPSQHYYLCADVFTDTDDPFELADELAKRRAGAIPVVMLSGMKKDDPGLANYPWRKYVRFALGGELKDTDGIVNYEQLAKEVEYWLDTLDEIRQKRLKSN